MRRLLYWSVLSIVIGATLGRLDDPFRRGVGIQFNLNGVIDIDTRARFRIGHSSAGFRHCRRTGHQSCHTRTHYDLVISLNSSAFADNCFCNRAQIRVSNFKEG